MAPRYSKEMPGADLIFRPGNLEAYAGQTWDIRISFGGAPLDEAYFFSVESFDAIDLPVSELLESYALNPEREAELEIDDYPDLPFLQQELIQYYEAARRGQFNLHVYVNRMDGELDLDTSARDVLSACTFCNRTWDYLVLDLVFDVEIPSADGAAAEAFAARYQGVGDDRGALRKEADELAAKYERYASVSVAPCALGVPDGFDVRLQMMELDGLDPARCILISLMADEEILPADAFDPVCEALAFKTNFTAEILDGLRAL